MYDRLGEELIERPSLDPRIEVRPNGFLGCVTHTYLTHTSDRECRTAAYQLLRQVGTECCRVAVQLLMRPDLKGDPQAALNHDPPHVGQMQAFAGYRYLEGQSLICDSASPSPHTRL